MEKDTKTKHNTQKRSEKGFDGVGQFVREVVKIFFMALVIIVPIRVFLFQPFFVNGASMEPNFSNGQYLIVNEFGYKKTDIAFDRYSLFSVEPSKDLVRDDVIVFRYPKSPKQSFIKRVIGLPGERVVIREGQVKIFNANNPQGMLLDESDILPFGRQTIGTADETLSEKEYFVLGDNRAFSHDSRAWGPVKKSDVIGKVFLRAWPLRDAKVY